MESENGLSSNLRTFTYNGRHRPVSSFPFFPSASSSYSNSPPVESKGNVKGPEGLNCHHRCSSESFLIEEQPSWLDDLLNDSDTHLCLKGHRRSASDTYAYLGDAAQKFAIREKSKFQHSFTDTSSRSGNQLVNNCKDNLDSTSNETKRGSFDEKINQESDLVSHAVVEQIKEECTSKNLEGSADRPIDSKVKSAASKAEAKRVKQHNAHRSRVRKLQYIAHLERTVQMLQTEASEVSGELEFSEQQNVILTMENRALRQRLESVSQEQMIKHWEQEMLKRELGRLQGLYHLQKQQQQMQLQNLPQQQPSQPQHEHSKQRRNRSRDLDHQSTGYPTKNKDAGSNKTSVIGSAWT